MITFFYLLVHHRLYPRLVIIISAERRILLDIDLPPSSLNGLVLCHPHSSRSCNPHQTTYIPLLGSYTCWFACRFTISIRELSVPTAIVFYVPWPADFHFNQLICLAMSVTLCLLRILSFLIQTHWETPSTAYTIAQIDRCLTLSLFQYEVYNEMPSLITPTNSDLRLSSLKTTVFSSKISQHLDKKCERKVIAKFFKHTHTLLYTSVTDN